MRLFFHVQHLLGIGHHRRAEHLVRAAVAEGFEVTVAAGGAPVPGEDWGGAIVHRLPQCRAADATFRKLLDENGQVIDDAWREKRAALLLEIFEAAKPDGVVLEGFPFARRQFRFELLPLLARVAEIRPKPVVFSSVRDILVFKFLPGRVEFVLDTVRNAVDQVLIHGDPSLIRLEESFPPASEIADKLAYTGYVTEETSLRPVEQRHGVVVSVGGGAAGEHLLRAALAARPLSSLRDRPWQIMAGTMTAPEVVADLTAQAPDGVTVMRHHTEFPQVLAGAELSISQAGYNTMLDLLRARPRALMVPMAAFDETEQDLRARLMERAGCALAQSETGLDGPTLAAAIDRAMALPEPVPPPLALHGASTAARMMRQRLEQRG